jgi:adenylate kinase
MVIFLAGVHGVGKTFLGKPAAETLGLKYATASSLIREALNGKTTWQESKYTSNIDANQEALVTAVNRIVESFDVALVLDGHFVLRNESGDLVSIPTDVFRRLGLSSVILLESPSSVIAERLEERGAPQSIEKISEMATAELNRAEQVCREIDIELTRLISPSSEQLLLTLRRLLSSAKNIGPED